MIPSAAPSVRVLSESTAGEYMLFLTVHFLVIIQIKTHDLSIIGNEEILYFSIKSKASSSLISSYQVIKKDFLRLPILVY